MQEKEQQKCMTQHEHENDRRHAMKENTQLVRRLVCGTQPCYEVALAGCCAGYYPSCRSALNVLWPVVAPVDIIVSLVKL